MPEPIVEETTTDIDATDAGEVEFEFNSSLLRTRDGTGYVLQLGPELEWLATDRLGTLLEVGIAREWMPGQSGYDVGVNIGLSWKLLHDFARDLHIQAELVARLPPTGDSTVEPGESTAPASLDVRSGYRRGGWTFRNSLGLLLERSPRYAPIRGSGVILRGFGGLGFIGLEAEVDGARSNPLFLAADIAPNLMALGWPFKIAVVLAYSPDVPDGAPAYGLLFRVFVESEREEAFERSADGRSPAKSSAPQ
jgi:hypothetical protein